MPKPISAEKKIEWEAKIRQQRESGLSVDRWCRQNQVTLCSFHYWKNRLRPKTELTRACFTELPVDQGTGISIEYQGMRILIDKSFDPSTLRSCLTALRGIQCWCFPPTPAYFSVKLPWGCIKVSRVSAALSNKCFQENFSLEHFLFFWVVGKIIWKYSTGTAMDSWFFISDWKKDLLPQKKTALPPCLGGSFWCFSKASLRNVYKRDFPYEK